MSIACCVQSELTTLTTHHMDLHAYATNHHTIIISPHYDITPEKEVKRTVWCAGIVLRADVGTRLVCRVERWPAPRAMHPRAVMTGTYRMVMTLALFHPIKVLFCTSQKASLVSTWCKSDHCNSESLNVFINLTANSERSSWSFREGNPSIAVPSFSVTL